MSQPQGSRPREDPYAATAALAAADQAQAAVRWGSRWVARYLYAWGLGTLLFLPLTGIARRQSTWLSLLWTAFVACTWCYARHQTVVVAGSTRLYALAVASWSVLWAGSLLLGFVVFPGNPGFWIPAGVLTSIPPFVAARAVRP